jgi:hypothetical protein
MNNDAISTDATVEATVPKPQSVPRLPIVKDPVGAVKVRQGPETLWDSDEDAGNKSSDTEASDSEATGVTVLLEGDLKANKQLITEMLAKHTEPTDVVFATKHEIAEEERVKTLQPLKETKLPYVPST